MFSCTTVFTEQAGGKQSAVVTIEGRATIEHAAEILSELRRAFAQSERVDLNLGRLEEADLSFIQLVAAARLSSAQNGKALTVSDEPSPVFRSVLRRASMLSLAQQEGRVA